MMIGQFQDRQVSPKMATEQETPSLLLSEESSSNQAILPVWSLGQTQKETPSLSLSSDNAQNLDANPTQITIAYVYHSLYRLTEAVYSNGFEFPYSATARGRPPYTVK